MRSSSLIVGIAARVRSAHPRSNEPVHCSSTQPLSVHCHGSRRRCSLKGGGATPRSPTSFALDASHACRRQSQASNSSRSGSESRFAFPKYPPMVGGTSGGSHPPRPRRHSLSTSLLTTMGEQDVPRPVRSQVVRHSDVGLRRQPQPFPSEFCGAGARPEDSDVWVRRGLRTGLHPRACSQLRRVAGDSTSSGRSAAGSEGCVGVETPGSTLGLRSEVAPLHPEEATVNAVSLLRRHS
jgi:hypothetical protein